MSKNEILVLVARKNVFFGLAVCNFTTFDCLETGNTGIDVTTLKHVQSSSAAKFQHSKIVKLVQSVAGTVRTMFDCLGTGRTTFDCLGTCRTIFPFFGTGRTMFDYLKRQKQVLICRH